MKLEEVLMQPRLNRTGDRNWTIKLWFIENNKIMGTGVGPVQGGPIVVADHLRQLADQVEALAFRSSDDD